MDTMEVRFYGTELLKGANPAALPVEQPTTFMMAINLKTAKQLGITIPSSISLPGDRGDLLSHGDPARP
ncbi:MAG: hypothetical protein O7G88_14655 [bacterium]|nr:hypothetical protein [bacterium]